MQLISYYTGVHIIPVSALKQPPVYLRVREAKEWYIDYLVKTLLEEGDDREDLTSPLLVVASVTKGEFRVKNVAHYTFEVGLQSHIIMSNIVFYYSL